MKIAVRYYTRSGNTKKVALAIAEALNVEAHDLTVPLEEKTDALFLGNSMYAFNIDETVKKFLEENCDKIGTLYNFGTAASPASTYKKVKKVATGLGIAMGEEEFHCYGKFGGLHKKRPDENDLKKAAAFATAAIEKL